MALSFPRLPRIPRAAPLALALSAAPLAAPAQTADTPPSTPGGLAARAYDATSGGVRWARSTDDRGVRGYEITRDGTVLGVRDTLSYVDTALAPDTRYRIGVTAIDTAGQRSGTVFATLATPPLQPGLGPSAPRDLRAEVYSRTAAELFWTRPATPGLRYEVRRDGAVLVTTSGVSHFDDGLAAGRTYTYEVVAIDRAGRRSAPSRVTLNTPTGGIAAGEPTPMPGDGPAITAENRVALLTYVFDVFNGSADGYGAAIVGLPGYSDSRYAGGVPADLHDTFSGYGPPETVVCGNGGTAVFTPYFVADRDTEEGWTSAFVECQDDATVLDGTLSRLYSSLLLVESDGLDVDGPTRRTRYAGKMTWEFADSRAGDTRSWNLEGVDVSLEEGGQSVFELSGADTRLAATFPYRRYLGGEFTVRSAATGGGALQVRTPEPLEENLIGQEGVGEEFAMPRFDTGTLEITAADGSRLTLDADNGDPATVDVTVTAGGESETFTDAWTLWAERLTCSFDRPLDPPAATEGCL